MALAGPAVNVVIAVALRRTAGARVSGRRSSGWVWRRADSSNAS